MRVEDCLNPLGLKQKGDKVPSFYMAQLRRSMQLEICEKISRNDEKKRFTRPYPMNLSIGALNWSRTSTPNEGHKALNLARLPIPPPGLVPQNYYFRRNNKLFAAQFSPADEHRTFSTRM